MKRTDRWQANPKEWLERHVWWIAPAGIAVNVALLIVVLNFKSGDRDALALSITVLEIFLVMLAFAGFWLVRGAAINAAKEEAKAAVERDIGPTVRRAVEEWLTLESGEQPDDIRAMMNKLDQEQEDDDNG